MDLVRSQRRIRTRRLLLAVGACGALVGVGVLAACPPTESTFYPRCLIHQYFGVHCPGCGLTRALHSLLNGQVEQALAYNGVGLVLLPIAVLAMARSLWAWASDERLGEAAPSPSRRWVAWALGAFLLLYGIVRNLPMEPFSSLAPHELPSGGTPGTGGTGGTP